MCEYLFPHGIFYQWVMKMMNKQKRRTYLFWILFTEGVGALSGWLSRDGMKLYSETAIQPPLSPPMILFPIVWGLLYLLMGIGAARIWMAAPSPDRSRGINLFLTQLILNFFWSLIFFRAQCYGFALLWLLVLTALVLWMILSFRRTDSFAAKIQIPYLIWLVFAIYLTAGVWVLNP